jgi:uncharacterized protein YndB with AHSA1/START domain
MLKVISIIAAVIALAIAVVVVLAFNQPDSFKVERSITIKAPPEKVFPLVDDFHAWAQWSPWEKLDPAMKRTYSGTPSGKGTVYEWTGDSKVGAGRMEITESSAPGKIAIQLDFFKPMEGRNPTVFTFTPKDGGTDVTWTMTGDAPFVTKIMLVFVSMDKMVGKDFETGLANMKAVAEK